MRSADAFVVVQPQGKSLKSGGLLSVQNNYSWQQSPSSSSSSSSSSRTSTALESSSSSSSSSNSPISASSLTKKLKLQDRFHRWKFLQQFLDDDSDISDEDIHKVLFAVLVAHQQSSSKNANITSKDIKEEGGSGQRKATPEQIETIEELLETFGDTQRIPAMVDDAILQRVAELIPDVQEEEDAFKGGWDVLMEVHGREIVKVNQQAATARWNALATVTRVLIHYDFLQEGVSSS